jgi:hypothetical protein
MIAGVLDLISIGNDELAVRWTVEIAPSNVLAKMALSAYQQGFSQDFTSFAQANLGGFFSGQGFTNLGRNALNNAYYIFGCTGVQFDLWGRFVHAYAEAEILPLASGTGFSQLGHVEHHFVLNAAGRALGQHRVSLLASGSRLDASAIASTSAVDLAARHGLARSDVAVQTVERFSSTVTGGSGVGTLAAP